MLVTQRDLLIANYAIKSYQKIDSKRLPYKLFIYANCLTKKQKEKYFPIWKKNHNVEIFDNENKVKKLNLRKWDVIISPEGVERIRDDANENYDELWSTELKKINTKFHATVDADFEIIKSDFVYSIIDYLNYSNNTIAMSTDYNETSNNVYESYSGLTINLWERWNTWFCIYKKEAHQCNISHFFYKTENKDGIPTFYDSASYFQNRLKEDFGWNLAVLDVSYQNEFIHYSAFSKNLSINKFNIGLYRRLRIVKKNGILNFRKNFFMKDEINTFSRKIANKIYSYFFSRTDKERAFYN